MQKQIQAAPADRIELPPRGVLDTVQQTPITLFDPMRRILPALLVGLLASASRSRGQTAPCTTPTTPCERWITFGAGPARSMVYASYRLDAANPAVTRALSMVHGAGRNADHYFETSMAAGFLAGALGNTIIIAPRFIAGQDKPSANEVMW